ncbi:hypothetical protein [Falsihalocynthiibacter arcticus]|uniref:Lipoprotein n=1 Tax=Falsihalocynthiibacter arcticus TaxID=1579316 RepID=A0A126UZH7_9RHOB|nr:hypothetical protein [Falsihalocynthiibacter arcticus]AML51444.1 hypothetical protein RC74_09400 [Falsihalocynthiibacter arcticus]
MRLSWAVLGLLGVAACGPTPPKTPKNTDECQSYAASRAGLSFSSVGAKQAYFSKVVTDTHGDNKTVRSTYLGCLDQIGALPEGVNSVGQSGSIPIGERTGNRSDVMSGGAGYKIVSFRSEGPGMIASASATGTEPLPLEYAGISGGADLWSTLSQSQQKRVQSYLSSGGAFMSSLKGGL